jgi:hypothetical protein
VHEEGAANSVEGALDSVLMHMHDGGTVSKEIAELHSKSVTFAEPGKGHQTQTADSSARSPSLSDSSMGSLSLSDGGEIASSKVTTSQSLTDSASISGTTVIITP